MPQRFEPPADAYGNEARGYRQIADTELGDALFTRVSNLVNESRTPAQELLMENQPDAAETLGYQVMVDKKLNGASSIQMFQTPNKIPATWAIPKQPSHGRAR